MSKAARQRSARERLAEERRRQAQRAQRTRALLVSVGAIVIVAVVVVVTVIIVNRKPAGEYTGAIASTSRQSDGSILMAQAGARAPKLEIFEDFQCPYCHQFEKTTSSMVKKLAAEGKVSVVYYPFWLFKDREEPIRGNSQRAANAALCAPGDTRWVKFHDKIYKNQPAEGSKGFSNKDLIGWAKDVGITGSGFNSCVTGLQKQSQLTQMTNYAENTRKVQGTPTVFLNGQQLSDSTVLSSNAGTLEKAILAAGPAPASATPSPSASKNK